MHNIVIYSNLKQSKKILLESHNLMDVLETLLTDFCIKGKRQTLHYAHKIDIQNPWWDSWHNSGL